MPGSAPPTIVLMGMMGSGKNSVGRGLEERTGWRYMDSDELVRAVSGRAPEEIDASDGEAVLHEAEADALRHALDMPGPLIVGAAAWVVVDRASVALLRAAPAVVYLRATPETLRERIGRGSGRRVDATDLEWLRARFAERDTTYREVATLTIEAEAIGPGAIAARILRALGTERP